MSVSMTATLKADEILLASGSPRRRDLLQSAGLAPVVKPVDLDESVYEGESGSAMVRRLALEKARSAADRYEEGKVVLAADTTVVHQGRILLKPESREEAVQMLLSLQEGQHEVLTALALIERGSGRELVRLTRSQLEMRDYTRTEVEEYVAGGSPLDKAGAYGIQDEGFDPVNLDEFEDCFTNVMGLPLCTLSLMLEELGWATEQDLVQACFDHRPHRLPVHEDVS